MVLTSLVNNKPLLKKVAKDMSKRFKIEIDEDRQISDNNSPTTAS
jgi:hypothetical protein